MQRNTLFTTAILAVSISLFVALVILTRVWLLQDIQAIDTSEVTLNDWVIPVPPGWKGYKLSRSVTFIRETENEKINEIGQVFFKPYPKHAVSDFEKTRWLERKKELIQIKEFVFQEEKLFPLDDIVIWCVQSTKAAGQTEYLIFCRFSDDTLSITYKGTYSPLDQLYILLHNIQRVNN